jgi:magnesium-dependent phosphatase 1
MANFEQNDQKISEDELEKVTNEMESTKIKDNNHLIDHDLIKHWKGLKRKPKVIVFDLDYTLWPYYVDCHVAPPIKKETHKKKVTIRDNNDYELFHYEDVPRILYTLKYHCFKDDTDRHLAIASKSSTKMLALNLIDHFNWSQYFSSFQIYPRSKTHHMNEIKKDLGDSVFTNFNEVLFFDDEPYNIKQTKEIGVYAHRVHRDTGLDTKAIFNGLDKFSKKIKD